MKTQANARAPTDDGPFYRGVIAALARIEDGTILRTAFFVLLAGTVGVLYVDYRELSAKQAEPACRSPSCHPPPRPMALKAGRARQ